MGADRRARIAALIGSGIFLIIAPGTIALYVPWTISRWTIGPPLVGFTPLRWAGVAMLAAGCLGLLDSFWRFAMQGLGTPAPLLPPRTLVMSGLYRYVRNPMYCAVVAVILGQALLFGSPRLIVYGLVIWLAFHLFVLGYEEPRLRATFGERYAEFCRNVRRWIPRLAPWQPARP